MKLALEYLVLTAARSGEVRLATWDEVDKGAATWTVPASRMKAGIEHRVPLCDRALAILDEARAIADGKRSHLPRHTHGQAAVGHDAVEAHARPWPRWRAARVPVELPRLGGGMHQRPARRNGGPLLPTRCATRSRPPTTEPICSSAGARSWINGRPTSTVQPASSCRWCVMTDDQEKQAPLDKLKARAFEKLKDELRANPEFQQMLYRMRPLDADAVVETAKECWWTSLGRRFFHPVMTTYPLSTTPTNACAT